MTAASKRRRAGRADEYAAVMRHHRSAWRVERVSWAIMALLLIASLLGLFGDGPLSHARSGSPRSVTVQYDRLLRSSAPAEYRFEANPTVVTGHELRLRFDQSLMDGIEIESIVPQPETEEAGPNSTEFAFRVKANTPVKVDLRYRPTTFGRRSGRVSAGGHVVLIDQFVYP